MTPKSNSGAPFGEVCDADLVLCKLAQFPKRWKAMLDAECRRSLEEQLDGMA